MRTRLRRLLITILLLAMSGSMGVGHSRAAPSCSTVADVVGLAATPLGTILAGTRGHGLYQAPQSGRCWTAIPSFPQGISVGTLVVLPHTSGVILAGQNQLTGSVSTTRSAGIYRSADAGKTWQQSITGLPDTAISPAEIAVSPLGTLVLAYSCRQDLTDPLPALRCPRGLARSADAGRTWQSVGPPVIEMTTVVGLAPGTFLAAGVPRPAKSLALRFFRSTDDGRSWHIIGTAAGLSGDLSLLFSPPWAKQEVLAGWGVLTFSGAIAQSVDGGDHWSPHHKEPGIPVAMIGLSAQHALLLSTIGKVYRSTDNGRTWTVALNARESVDLQSWALLAAPDGKTAYVGTAEGVVSTRDGGHTWQTPLS